MQMTLPILALMLPLALPSAAADGCLGLPCPDPALPPPCATLDACHVVAGGVPDNCTVEPLPPGWGVSCGVEGPCGVGQYPVCWTLRTTCFWVGEALERQLDFSCETQPECCNTTATEGNCNNYGILVVLVVASEPVCDGQRCRNEGVLVAVGPYCNGGTRACVEALCLTACTAPETKETIGTVSRSPDPLCDEDDKSTPIHGPLLLYEGVP